MEARIKNQNIRLVQFWKPVSLFHSFYYWLQTLRDIGSKPHSREGQPFAPNEILIIQGKMQHETQLFIYGNICSVHSFKELNED